MIPDENEVKDYFSLRGAVDSHAQQMHDVIMHPNHCMQFLQPGRLVRIKFNRVDFGWGAIVNYNPRQASKGEQLNPQTSYVVDVLLPIASDAHFVPHASLGLPIGVRPPPEGERGRMEVVPVLLSCIDTIGHLRIFLPDQLQNSLQKNVVRKTLDEVKKRFPDGIAVLDPIENMGITDDSFKNLLRVRSPTLVVFD